jgi:SIR2-like domain
MPEKPHLIMFFERLLDRMLDECVIPFLGAGVSYSATHPDDPKFKATLDYMKSVLKEKISSGANPNSHEFEFIEPILSRDNYSLDVLSELGGWLHGKKWVCETLRIKEFEKLIPLEAHYYISYIAREGLVREIISTNYDCCIEKAYRNTFDPNQNPYESLKVIRNLEQYRKDGGKQYTDSSQRQPILHLYKINGCAKEYGEIADAERIILTERQLQTFRDEQWAKDLFRDRARRRNFLFCGFGSSEPQVRHTALAICEEFQLHGRNSSENDTDIAALPNSPFLVVKSKPTFPQLQILHAFIYAHLNNGTPKEAIPSCKALECCSNHYISGKDASILGASDEALLADLFFKRLYQAVFGRLLIRQTERGSVFFNWISTLTSNPARWCWFLRKLLYPVMASEDVQNDTDFSDECRLGTPLCKKTCGDDLTYAYFGAWPCLMESISSDNNGPMLFWYWLWAMKYPTKPFPEGSHWYLPMRDDALFILAALTLLVFLQNAGGRANVDLPRLQCPDTDVLPVRGFGLEVRVRDGKDFEPLYVYLVHRYAGNRIDRGEGFPGTGQLKKKRFYYRISVPSANLWATEERLAFEEGRDLNRDGHADLQDLWVAKQQCISAETLIRQAGTPERLSSAVRATFARSRPITPHVKLEPVS